MRRLKTACAWPVPAGTTTNWIVGDDAVPVVPEATEFTAFTGLPEGPGITGICRMVGVPDNDDPDAPPPPAAFSVKCQRAFFIH